MAEPRLASLSYRVLCRVPERWDLSNLGGQSFSLGGFDCEIEGQSLEARPRVDFPDEESARAELEPLLDQWEAVIELERQVPVRFRFRGSYISQPAEVDEQGNITRRAGVLAAVEMRASGRVVTGVSSLPPPSPFSEPAELRVLRERIRDYRHGRERLLALGYFAYTTFTGHYGGGRNVAKAMKVEPAVFEMLNELTSKRTSPEHGRKAIRGPALSDEEHRWVEVAVVALAKRMGEVEAGVSTPLLTMASLPSLP
jgi:hypothetical protein